MSGSSEVLPDGPHKDIVDRLNPLIGVIKEMRDNVYVLPDDIELLSYEIRSALKDSFGLDSEQYQTALRILNDIPTQSDISNFEIVRAQLRRLQNFLINFRDRQYAEARRLARAQSITPATPHPEPAGQSIFLAHGHDHASRDKVELVLNDLRQDVVLLHKETEPGLVTIIEMFERKAEKAGYAIILLTPDDVGATVNTPSAVQARARQNVIFELGYFVGKLGRDRVAILRHPSVEFLSELHGVLTIPFEDKWDVLLAHKLKAAKLQVDLNDLKPRS